MSGARGAHVSRAQSPDRRQGALRTPEPQPRTIYAHRASAIFHYMYCGSIVAISRCMLRCKQGAKLSYCGVHTAFSVHRLMWLACKEHVVSSRRGHVEDVFKHTLATLPRSSLLLRCGRHHARSSQGKEGTRISPRHWVSTDCRSRPPRAYPGEYNRRAEAAEANISSIGARAQCPLSARRSPVPPQSLTPTVW